MLGKSIVMPLKNHAKAEFRLQEWLLKAELNCGSSHFQTLPYDSER